MLFLPQNIDENLVLNNFNNFHKSLRFTMEKEENGKVNFLDVSVTKNDGQLFTTWYRKSSNTLMFNQWNSLGPKIYKINLIRTMINRLKIICSNKWIFNRDLKQLRDSFLWS